MPKKKKKKKKVSLKKAARELVRIAESHLSTLPLSEREERITAIERTISRACDESRATPSGREHTRETRVSARGRDE